MGRTIAGPSAETSAARQGFPLLVLIRPVARRAPQLDGGRLRVVHGAIVAWVVVQAWVFIASYSVFGALVAWIWWRRPLPSGAWSLVAAVGLAAGLAGCASPAGAPDVANTRQRPAMDIARMCEVHELMMAGSSAEEQRIMLEQYLRSMHGSVDAAMVARHRQAMADCPPALPASR